MKLFIVGLFLCCLGLPMALTAAPSSGSLFDHQSTGYPLEGAHLRAACDSCHVGEVFQGTPRQCDGCHTMGSLVQATAQPPHHIMVRGDCESCHRLLTWAPVLRVDHTEVVGSCSSCHNNARVAGQPVGHIQTPLECDSCHSVRRWSLQ